MFGEDIQAFLKRIILYTPQKGILYHLRHTCEALPVDVNIIREGEILNEVIMEGNDEGRIEVAFGFCSFGDLAEGIEIKDDGVHEVVVKLFLGKGDEGAEDVDIIDDTNAEVGELRVGEGVVVEGPLANKACALT